MIKVAKMGGTSIGQMNFPRKVHRSSTAGYFLISLEVGSTTRARRNFRAGFFPERSQFSRQGRT